MVSSVIVISTLYLKHIVIMLFYLITVFCVHCAVMMHAEKILLVTADDFGYDCDRNRGIVECFQNCAITRASVLVNGIACREAFALANLHGISLGEHRLELFSITDYHTCK